MTNLPQRVDLSLVRQMMEVSGAGLLLAISGGVDSVVLLDILLAAGIKPALAHVNYGLRGDDSEADAVLVQQLARQHDLAFHLRKIMPEDWPAHQSTEMGARNLRYRWFTRLCRDFGYQAVITAHHLDDTLETVMLNLVRGTGMAGLGGMAPITTLRFDDQELCVLRPLLGVNKQMILDYAASQNLIWREDLSNQTDQYQRNVMRHKVMPALQQSFPTYEKTMPRSLARIGEELKLLAQLKRRFRRAIDQGQEAMLVGEVVLGYGPKISPKAYLKHLILLKPILAKIGMTSANQQEALALLRADIGLAIKNGFWYLQGQLKPLVTHGPDQPKSLAPFSKRAWMTPSHVVILDRHRLFLVPKASYQGCKDLATLDPVLVPAGKYTLPTPALGIIDRRTITDPVDVPSNAMVFDPEKVGPNSELWLRPMQAGDKIKRKGMSHGHKSLVDALSELGLPDHHKQATFVVTLADGRIVWVVNRAVNTDFALNGAAKGQIVPMTAIWWSKSIEI